MSEKKRVAFDRRRFMRATGVGLAGFAGVNGSATGEGDGNGRRLETQNGTAIELEAGYELEHSAPDDHEDASDDVDHVISWRGDDYAWFGVSPEAIEDETNPTLSLDAGETYTIEWTNTTGDFHNVVIEDADGNEELATDGLSEEGATETVEFTATEEMAEYYCSSHPEEMRGPVDVGDPTVQSVSVLVISVTGDFRHEIIPFANQTLQEMDDRIAAATGAGEVTIDVIDDSDGDASAFPSTVAELEQYDTIVWNSTTGSPLDADQRTAFQEYVRNGGGYVGVHSASNTHPEWEWFGSLTGADFDGHPEPQNGTVVVEDRVHPSTATLPARLDVFDEFYDFESNPRGDVHVLATLDEDSYDGAAMENGRVDHPIAWCQEFQGGRSWYTALGHTEEIFESEHFLEHVLQGILWTSGLVDGDASATVWDAYERVELTTALDSDNRTGPMSMTIAPDGRVFVVHRSADVLVIDPDTFETTTALEREFWTEAGNEGDNGGLGIAVDPNFEANGYVYLYYAPLDAELDNDEDMPYNLLSRFEVEGDELVPESEVELLRVHQQRETSNHCAGEIQFGPDGNLFLSTGDNVTPFESSGYTPIDERTTDPNTNDAQGTAGDTSDLRGSILRITPEDDGSYSIPDDNLFTEAQGYGDEIDEGLVRPEIFAMGFRNPFRFSVDAETGWVYMADYGPDAGDWGADRGPLGIRLYNQIREPGNYGWPFARGAAYPYVDYDFETGESGDPFDATGPINESVNNDGLTELPPVEDSTFFVPTNWDNYLTPPADGVWDVPEQIPYPAVTDRSPNGGPLVRLDDDRADAALPDYFDGKWIVGEWNDGNFQLVSFDDDGDLLEISPFLPDLELEGPQDMEIGPHGRLHYIEWGAGFAGENPGIYRIDHAADGRIDLTVSLDSETITSGETVSATTTLTNSFDETDIETVEFALIAANEGVETTATGATTYESLAAGETQTVDWEISADEDASDGEYDLTAAVTYSQDGEDEERTRAASVSVVGGLEDGRYRLVASHSDLSMEVENGTLEGGANVQQNEWSDEPHQHWHIETVDDGDDLYRIEAADSGYVLEVADGSREDAANVQIGEDGGEDHQRWTISSIDDGLVAIQAAHSEQAVDVSGVSTDPGGNAIQWPYEGADNQHWELHEIAEPEPDADTVLESNPETLSWRGIAPSTIDGEVNPTLSMEEGETHTVRWQNTDGGFHNFVIENEAGDTLVETETISGPDEIQEVTFTATGEMAEYYCGPHAEDMRGAIELH